MLLPTFPIETAPAVPKTSPQNSFALTQETDWYKDAIVYEAHIKAFFDSDANGIGDLSGMIAKLDYLESLGITALWLLPFYPSPQRDDGYDIADYLTINPDYGTLKDFKELLREAHKRGIRVITELVLNHTSDKHIWFQRARVAEKGSEWRDFYVWSDTPELYGDARIIFKDFETSNWTWDSVAHAYYWHRFYSHQPDLNFNNPEVQKAMFKVIDMWLHLGVDGLRLDAVPYLFEEHGTNCENLPETHEFLKKLRAHVDRNFSGKMLLAEANQWTEDAVAYFGNDDECHTAFHFPLMPRLFMAVEMEDRFPIVDILEQTPSIPSSCQWMIFLRNHDELTLEMVTDEEREFMYRQYAQNRQARINVGIRRRLAPLLENNRAKIELMNMLLFSLPGTPVIYYGDEIGMGDNFYLGDRNGVRTPMQWSADKNAGFSRANPQQLYLPIIIDPEYHYEAVNVEIQERNPSSLLWWMRRTIALRKRFRAFGRGDMKFVLPDNPKVIAFVRTYHDETIVVVLNVSQFAQSAHIPLAEYQHFIPYEIESGSPFPMITGDDYPITLNPFGYYWFVLQPQLLATSTLPIFDTENILSIRLGEGDEWKKIFEEPFVDGVEKFVIPKLLINGLSATEVVSTVSVIDVIHLPFPDVVVALVEVVGTDGSKTVLTLPLGFMKNSEDKEISDLPKPSALATIIFPDTEGILVNALESESMVQHLSQLYVHKTGMRWNSGVLEIELMEQLETDIVQDAIPSTEIIQNLPDTVLAFDDRHRLRLRRVLHEGSSINTEILKVLNHHVHFYGVPKLWCTLSYKRRGGQSSEVASFETLPPNEGSILEMLTASIATETAKLLTNKSLQVSEEKMPNLADERIDKVFTVLGEQLARLHNALATEKSSAFAPEPFTMHYQRSIYQTLRSEIRQTIDRLEQRYGEDEVYSRQVQKLMNGEDRILRLLKTIFTIPMQGMKVRLYGNRDLGSIFFTGERIILTDFEGDTSKAISERRLKRSPLRDVAFLCHSIFETVVHAVHRTVPSDADELSVNLLVEMQYRHIEHLFLESYLRTVEAALVPNTKEAVFPLLKAFALMRGFQTLRESIDSDSTCEAELLVIARAITQMQYPDSLAVF